MSPSFPTATYTMEDLTSATGVTARTVRYYIAEGLLPPPEGAGPATTYTNAHRNRLLLIGQMKDAYLPLKEIRRRLAAMREDEIAAAVEEPATQALFSDAVPDDATPPMPAAQVRSRSSQSAPDAAADAAAYIDGVLRREAQPASRRLGSVRPQPLPAPTSPSAPVDPTTRIAGASWKRLPITPEAELVIEESSYHRRQEQVDAALDWLRRILNGS